MQFKKENYILFIKMLFLQLVSTFAMIFIFACVMYFTESGYGLSPLYATLSLAVGCFVSSLYLSQKTEKRGIVVGFLVGVITFLTVTLITLAVNNNGISFHLLLRMFIMLLSSMLGGIIGVNRKSSQKFI